MTTQTNARPRCRRCGGRMYDSTDHEGHSGPETTCIVCGWVSYGEGFVPLDKIDPETGIPFRSANHGGQRL